MSDQCALDKSSGLKEAEDIEFFHSESETIPLPPPAVSSQQNLDGTATSKHNTFVHLHSLKPSYDSELRRGQRRKNVEKMHASIAAERRNEFGAVIKKHRPHRRGQQSSRPLKKSKVDATAVQDPSDPDDTDFVSSDESLMETSEAGDTEINEAEPLIAEVCFTIQSFNSH